MHWQTTRFTIDLTWPQVMGIVNLTADSFSDGGHCLDARAALRHAEQMLRDGAQLLDLGAESGRVRRLYPPNWSGRACAPFCRRPCVGVCRCRSIPASPR